tara:strand:+ start:137 stop:301 length:165 start_codon:yes stop_codon:yes gene_type:complete
MQRYTSFVWFCRAAGIEGGGMIFMAGQGFGSEGVMKASLTKYPKNIFSTTNFLP